MCNNAHFRRRISLFIIPSSKLQKSSFAKLLDGSNVCTVRGSLCAIFFSENPSLSPTRRGEFAGEFKWKTLPFEFWKTVTNGFVSACKIQLHIVYGFHLLKGNQ